MIVQLKELSREEHAQLEIGHTEFRPGAKWTLFVIGLFTLFSVPVAQTCLEWRLCAEGRHETGRAPCRDILAALPRAGAAYREHQGGWISKTFRANTVLLQAIDRYERDLKAESFLTHLLVPPAQEILARAGSGNEQGYIGRRGWLFYRPGIDYCTGPGFLQPRRLAERADRGAQGTPPVQPDPRAAILAFHRQLAERDIQLVVMPIPNKATIHPEQFSSRYEDQVRPVQNPSYRPFVEELEAAGVLVCDVTDTLARYRASSAQAAYLATDTHWRPEALELAATQLAELIDEKISFRAPPRDRHWRRTSQYAENLGDIAMMLKLPAHQRIFPVERVTIRPVTDAAGAPWQPERAAEILLLGDSFANIYSLEMMNWGGAAGLAEQLSFALQRPVDTILQNDAGASATRQILSRELAQGEDRLTGKRVVVWQFAARELAVGDWRLLDMRVSQSSRPNNEPPPAQREVIVSGTIVAKSAAPRAGQMPYAHHIFTVDLTDLQVHGGTLTESKIAVYLFSMRNRQNTPAFSWPVGTRVKLTLQAWKPRFFAQYGRINRTETDDIELEYPWWGEVIE